MYMQCLPLSESSPVVEEYDAYYAAKYNALMSAKLGLVRSAGTTPPPASQLSASTAAASTSSAASTSTPSASAASSAADHKLVESLLDTMELTAADFTNTFRALSQVA